MDQQSSNRLFRTWLLPLTLATLACSFIWAQSIPFPYNGDFEAGAGAPGWELSGEWEVKTQAMHTGRVGLLLADAQAGDNILTTGYLPVKPGELLRLQLSYRCPEGGLEVALQPCDLLGQICGDLLTERLPATPEWADVDKRLELPAEGLSSEFAAVRLVINIHQTGAQVSLDSVCLTPVTTATAQTLPALPKTDTSKTPNLLPSLDTLGTSTSAWSALNVTGYEATQVRRNQTATAAGKGALLTGGALRGGMISRRQVMDCSVPYRITAELTSPQWQSGRLLLLARYLDPAYPGVVWHQSEAFVLATEGATTLMVSLPRLAARPTPALLQVALVLDNGAVGEVLTPQVIMQPEVMSLGVRLAANAKPGPENVTLFISAINNTSATLKPTCWLKTLDTNGQTAHVEKRLLTVGPRSAGYFPYKPKLPGVGNFRMLARIIADGKDVGSATFAFRVKSPEPLGGLTSSGLRRVSSGYLQVMPTAKLRIGLAYRGQPGGPAAGVELCDPLGRPLGVDLPLEVSPSNDWTHCTGELDLSQAPPEAGVVGAVRLFTRIPERPGTEDFDTLVLSDVTQPARPLTPLTYPAVDLRRPVNLLPIMQPDEIARGQGKTWEPWVGLNFGPGQAVFAPDTSLTNPVFTLTGSELAAAWITSPQLLDGSVPYSFTLLVDTTQLTAGTGYLLARFLDPASPHVVLWQQLLPLKPENRERRVALSIPRQFTEPRAEALQLAVVLDAKAEGLLCFSRPVLQPEPLTVSLRRGASGAGNANPLSPQIYCSAVNNGTDELRPEAVVTVADPTGRMVHTEKRAIVIGARSAAYFPFVLRLPAAGMYEVNVAIMTAGKELGSATMELVVGEPETDS